jgi:hypothetical protein
MDTLDLLRLIHPAIAIVWVLPLAGIATRYSLQTRERRLAAKAKVKTKLPPTVGLEHVTVGRWLAASVVGVALIGLGYPIIKHLVRENIWAQNPFQVVFIGLLMTLTVATTVLLYRARAASWRATFATLTTMGLILLGCQDGVFRRGNEWFVSHYYYGLLVAILMVLSITTLPEIYRSPAWRRAHIFFNAMAVLLFIGQGITGARDLLEIPLSWQEPFIYSCDFVAKTCQ